MAISAIGIGSGLEATTIIDQLVALEKTPLTRLQSRASVMSSQLSALGQIKAKMSTLQDAATALSKPELWTKTSASTTDNSSVSVSSTVSAASGEYSVGVTQLAKSQNLASAAFTDSGATVGAGFLRIELGRWTGVDTDASNGIDNSGVAFAAKTGSTAVDIEFDADDTLADIRTKINAAKAGVTASIVNDASGTRLVIRSDSTGEENAMRISEVDSDGNAVAGGALGSAFGYDFSGGATSPMSQTVAAQDAKATINGLNLQSASNTFNNVADGMSFTAVKVTTSDVTLKVGTDTASFKTALNKFTTAYNDLNNTLRTLTKYDETTETGAILQGDSTATSIQNQLRNLVQGTGGSSSVFSRLSDLGIAMQRDGSLVTDDSKLNKALEQPAEVAKALSSPANALPGQRGIGALFASFASVITGTNGTLTSRTESLTSRIKTNSNEQDRVSARIDATRARLEKQYSALDTTMATLNGLNSYISQQITNWNKSTG